MHEMIADRSGRASAPGVSTVVRGPEEARQAVTQWADRGFRWIRVRPPIRPDVLAAVIDAAHARGLWVAGRVGAARR